MNAASASSIAAWRVGRRVLVLVSLGFVAVLLAAASAGMAVIQAQDHTAWVSHTFEVERDIGDIDLAIERLRSSSAARSTAASSASDQALQLERANLSNAILRFARLTADNPRQQVRVPPLRRLAVSFVTELADAPGGSSYQQLRVLTAAMLAEEQRLLPLRAGSERASIRRFWIVLASGGALLASVAAATLLTIGRYTRDLAQSRGELEELNLGLEQAVRDRTTELQRANDEIQRFAYIVSHDLRSPLVNVMGFTAELDAATKPLAALIARVGQEAPELLSKEARLAVEEDLPEAVGFIRSSTQKMDRLINAILKLSREGRRTISPEQLDMSALAAGVAENVRHRLTELGATLTIDPTLPGIVSDRFAVEQIVANLIENAVKYLKPGRSGDISVAGKRVGGRAMFLVSDNGRGIEARDHQRIFDLFRRSGAQDQPGEGIGLAHVRALAYRLGDTIEVASELDRGSTFTINLPVTYRTLEERG